MAVCLPSCSLTPTAELQQTVRTGPAQILAHLHPKTLPEESSRVAYLKRSMSEPRKLRKLLCRLMWLSSSSLILPKTYRREKKGLIIQARAQHGHTGTHPRAAGTGPAPGPSPPKEPLCAIPHGKAAQCAAKELALSSH